LQRGVHVTVRPPDATPAAPFLAWRIPFNLPTFWFVDVSPRQQAGALMPVVLDADRIGRTLTRIAHEIVERNRGVEDLAFVGIRRRGVPLARRLAALVGGIVGAEVPIGALDITLYRDDLMRHSIGGQPSVGPSDIRFSIDDKRILLVDDVLYTGRTIRAALDALLEFGRPRSIQLVVLVDRGHRELPIKADYVGKNLPTSLAQSVQVHLLEVDGRDGVEILE